MTDLGDIPFRTGGTSGAAHFLFGSWAELGEGVLHFDAFVCQSCGRIQLFADRQTRDSLGRLAANASGGKRFYFAMISTTNPALDSPT